MKRFAVLSLALACACGGRWPASMEEQPSLRPLEGAPRLPPSGAIPVAGIEVVEDRQDVEDLQSPWAGDPTAADRGAVLFPSHCACCHGERGDGTGPVSRVFPPAPDLRHVSICRRSDGFIYGTLTAGGRAMPPMREALDRRQRWELVAFVRRLQAQGCVGSAAGMDQEP